MTDADYESLVKNEAGCRLSDAFGPESVYMRDATGSFAIGSPRGSTTSNPRINIVRPLQLRTLVEVGVEDLTFGEEAPSSHGVQSLLESSQMKVEVVR